MPSVFFSSSHSGAAQLAAPLVVDAALPAYCYQSFRTLLPRLHDSSWVCG